jgi:hypothetical protein
MISAVPSLRRRRSHERSASPEVSRITIRVTGAFPQNIGIFVIGNSGPILKEVDVASTQGGQNWGFYINSNTGFPGSTRIYRSRGVGSTAALLLNAFATVYAAHTQLEGPVVNAGTLTCLGAYDGAFLAAGCP